MTPLLTNIWDALRQLLCCSEPKDKLTGSHDCVEDKGLIYKNPATEGSPTTSPPHHSNGRIPNGESRGSPRDTITPITEEAVQIELCDSEKGQPAETESDSEMLISMTAKNLVEDAIQKAVSSEVVSFVIYRTLGALLVERATTNAQRFLTPESV